MSFLKYLSESTQQEKIDLDEFIKKIKSKGLYGYDVFKHIDESELRKILDDDEYFNKMKSSSQANTISEMVLPPNKQNPQDKEVTQDKLSLAVKLGLTKSKPNTQNPPVKPGNNKPLNVLANPEKPVTAQSFADRMKAEYEKRKAEREEQEAKRREIADQRLALADKERERNQAEPVFANTSMDYKRNNDKKYTDKQNDELDKKLTNAMFAAKRANKKTDSAGYSKVTNSAKVSDKSAEEKLSKAYDKKYNSSVPKRTSNEYSKRTLLAIADRMDFDVYCKFRKADSEIRTGNFRIGKTESQITQKQDTIIVQDLDLSAKEKKVVWRTIPLERIIEIKPL